jgi:hypothetical protein
MRRRVNSRKKKLTVSARRCDARRFPFRATSRKEKGGDSSTITPGSSVWRALYELQTHVELCRRLRYLPEKVADTLMEHSIRVAQLINGTLRSVVNQRIPKRPPVKRTSR